MRDVRQHETSLDDRRRAIPQDLPRLAPFEGGHAVLGIQPRLQHGIDLCRREIALLATVENHVKRIDRALGLPEMIGDDTDRVVARRARERRMLRACVFVGDGDGCDPRHRMHARPFEDLGFVSDRHHRPGEGRRHPDRGVQHAGQGDIDAEERAAGRFGP
jgi:hypothetical protein